MSVAEKSGGDPTSAAAEAVLVRSEAMPEGSETVQGEGVRHRGLLIIAYALVAVVVLAVAFAVAVVAATAVIVVVPVAVVAVAAATTIVSAVFNFPRSQSTLVILNFQ